jgi:excisionase family DNA binding protein
MPTWRGWNPKMTTIHVEHLVPGDQVHLAILSGRTLYLAGHLTPAGARGRTMGLVRRDSVEAFQYRQSTALSVIQAAKRLGIGRRCILDLIHAGSLPGAVRSKAGWRIPEETIEAILAD